MEMALTYIFLAVYIGILIYIGIKDHNTEDKDGFIIGDRKIGFLGTMASTSAGLRNGGALILWVGFGFAMGYNLYIFFLSFLIGFFLLSLVAPRARRIAKERNYITMQQFVRDEIGPKTEKVAAFITIAFSVLSVGTQFFVLGSILHAITGWGAFNSILLVAAVVAFYVTMGGYKSIIKTDIVQFFIMLSAWVFLLYRAPAASDVLNLSSSYSYMPTSEIISILFLYPIFVFCMSDAWQRIFSAKDDKAAKRGINFSGWAMLIMTLPLTYIGMAAKGIIPAGTAHNDVFDLLISNQAYPPALLALLTVIGFSVCMSSLDTRTYLFSSTLLENFMKFSIKTNKKKYIRLSKIIILTMLGLSSVIALHIGDVVKYMLNIGSIMTILAPLFIVTATGIMKKKSKKLDDYFMWALVASFAYSVYIFAQGYMTTFAIRSTIPVVSISLLTGAYLLSRSKKHI